MLLGIGKARSVSQASRRLPPGACETDRRVRARATDAGAITKSTTEQLRHAVKRYIDVMCCAAAQSIYIYILIYIYIYI
jgi:hypothetical protein